MQEIDMLLNWELVENSQVVSLVKRLMSWYTMGKPSLMGKVPVHLVN